MRKALLLPVLLGLGLVIGAAPAGAVQAKPTFSFKMGSFSATEGNSGMTTPKILITRSSSKGPASVVFSTPASGTTATPGTSCSGFPADFINQPGTTIAFADGTSQVQVPVSQSPQICGDNVYEPNETVMLQLSSPSAGYNIANKNTVPLTIVNDDPVPRITIDNTSGDEGTQLTFTLHLSGPTQSGVSVNAATADGSATTPDDYTAKNSPPVTWGTNDAADKVFHVLTTDDGKYSLGESFLVNLSGATGATIGNTPATGSLNELDPKPSLTASDAKDWEGNTLNFSVSQSAVSEAPTTFSWQTLDGTANAGTCLTPGDNDYTAASSGGAVTIAAGSTSAGPFPVSTCQDSVPEPNETFSFHLTSPVNSTINSDGTGTIKDDDPAVFHFLTAGRVGTDEYITGIVTNTSLDPLNSSNGSPVMVRFERYTDGNLGGGFEGVVIAGPGGAGYDNAGDNQDVFANPTIGDEGAGTVTYRYAAPATGTHENIVGCAVTSQSTDFAACGVANEDDGPSGTYGESPLDYDDGFGPMPNSLTDMLTLHFL